MTEFTEKTNQELVSLAKDTFAELWRRLVSLDTWGNGEAMIRAQGIDPDDVTKIEELWGLLTYERPSS